MSKPEDISELLPCPFCGVREAVLYANDGDFAVECDNCNNRTSKQNTAAEAIAAWNRRPLDARIAAAIRRGTP